MPESNKSPAPARRGANDPGSPDCGGRPGRRDDGGKPSGNDRTKIESVPLGTWLFMHYDFSDTGARPVASGDTFWESPDIWFDGGDSLGNAIPGKPTLVHARIWNDGYLKATNTRVDFAFVDAALGISWNQPQPITKSPSWLHVPEKILGPGFGEVPCRKEWIPAAGSTHACLLVMCSCKAMNDMPAQPWSPATDRHVAQHNVNIASAGVGELLTFHLHTTNVTPMPAAVQIAARVAWVEAKTPRDALRYSSTGVRNALAALSQASQLQQMRLLANRTSRIFQHSAEIKGTDLQPEALREVVRLGDVEAAGRAKNGAIVIPSMNAVRGLNGYTPIDKVTELRPLQHRKASLEIKVPRPAGNARQLLVRLAQFENGFATGGYTVVISVKG